VHAFDDGTDRTHTDRVERRSTFGDEGRGGERIVRFDRRQCRLEPRGGGPGVPREGHEADGEGIDELAPGDPGGWQRRQKLLGNPQCALGCFHVSLVERGQPCACARRHAQCIVVDIRCACRCGVVRGRCARRPAVLSRDVPHREQHGCPLRFVPNRREQPERFVEALTCGAERASLEVEKRERMHRLRREVGRVRLTRRVETDLERFASSTEASRVRVCLTGGEPAARQAVLVVEPNEQRERLAVSVERFLEPVHRQRRAESQQRIGMATPIAPRGRQANRPARRSLGRIGVAQCAMRLGDHHVECDGVTVRVQCFGFGEERRACVERASRVLAAPCPEPFPDPPGRERLRRVT
jgi:hypothetical protein